MKEIEHDIIEKYKFRNEIESNPNGGIFSLSLHFLHCQEGDAWITGKIALGKHFICKEKSFDGDPGRKIQSCSRSET